ncbi:MAG: hypothetical protein E6G60_14880, partial [Actinobacteria bacterium]
MGSRRPGSPASLSTRRAHPTLTPGVTTSRSAPPSAWSRNPPRRLRRNHANVPRHHVPAGGDHVFPARFDYVAARTVEEAIAAKATGDETRFLAGGQSLIPMMKTRLAVPAKLVDINRIPDLDGLERVDGHLRVGALVRHAQIVQSDLAFGAIASAAPWISDPLVRNLGTMCGSVAHCDPEGDWNSVLLAT